MRPDKTVCKMCGKEIAKGKWCSDKCRKAYARNPDKVGQNVHKKADKPNPDTENTQVGQEPGQPDDLRSQLTKTDKSFYDRAMKDFGEPWYRFNLENPLRDVICNYCNKPFKTSLSLCRFCSYEHSMLVFKK